MTVPALVAMPFLGSDRANASIGDPLVPVSPPAVTDNSGTYQTSVPIEVPPFRGLEPELGLSYNSAERNGMFGMGWTMAALSTIERKDPKRGAATWTASDMYVLDGEPLVASTSLGGTHVTKRQSYRRISFIAATNSWQVIDTHGVKRTYAVRTSATTAAGVAVTPKWLLSAVTDPYGNTVTYSYWCDGSYGVCYPDRVTYNQASITFYRELRPDPVSAAVGGAVLTEMRYRIRTIDVKVVTSRARAYQLTYATSVGSKRSLLAAVRRYGTDAVIDPAGAVTAGTAMPPMTLSYSDGVPSSQIAPISLSRCTNAQSFLGDFNGDNFLDLGCRSARFNQILVAVGDGYGGFSSANMWVTNYCSINSELTVGDINGDNRDDLICNSSNGIWIAFADASYSFQPAALNAMVGTDSTWCVNASGLVTQDVNGDGKDDMVCRPYGTYERRIAYSDGSGMNFSAGPSPRYGSSEIDGCVSYEHVPYSGDFNGDGRLDAVCFHSNGLNQRVAHVGLLTAAGTLQQAGGSPICQGVSTGEMYSAYGVGDFNGDGFDDVFCAAGDTYSWWRTWVGLSTGDGRFVASPVPWDDSTCAPDEVGDFDGDGRADVTCGNHNVLFSRGASFAVAWKWLMPNNCVALDFQDAAFPVDVDDDGRADLVCVGVNLTGAQYVWLALSASGQPANVDLLRTATTETGGTTTVDYGALHAYTTYGNQPKGGRRPLAVTRVTTNGGFDVSYEYGEWVWDRAERRFLGYVSIRAHDQRSWAWAWTYTAFRVVANQPVSRPTEVSIGNPITGYSWNTTRYTWAEATSGGIYTSRLASTVTDWHSGDNSVSQKLTTNYQYDGYGNRTRQTDVRDAAEAGNDRVTATSYVYDTSKYIVDTPQVVAVFGDAAMTKTLRKTTYGYDGSGQVTSVARLVNPATGETVTATFGYDWLGNLAGSMDENKQQTTYSYDSVFHVFPVRTCKWFVSPQQCTANGWDRTMNRPISHTDANNQTTSTTYDVLGRATKETRPDGSSTSTTYNSWGSSTAQYVQTSVSDGTADGQWSRTYVDGFGRTYKTVAEPDITVLTEFNNVGMVRRVSNPFRTGSTAVYTSYAYDGNGRQVRVIHPDGSEATTSYGIDRNPADADFAAARQSVVQCDEVSVCRRTSYDSFGAALVVSEWNGSAEYRTHASYDEVGQLLTIADSAGNGTALGWDGLGRKTSMRDPDLGLWSYGYDAASHLTSQTDPRGQKLVNAYDMIGRLTTQTVGTTVVATHRYDEAGHGYGIGRKTSMTDQSGSTSWTYDTLGRPTSTVKTIGASSYTVKQSFDLAGRRSSLTYPDNEVANYGYDASGCLTSVGGYVTAATCNPNRSLATRTLGNTAKQAYGYDSNRQWLNAWSTNDSAGSAIISEAYGHRANGQVSSKFSSDVADRWSYTYDGLNRLTSASNSVVTAYSSAYSYDKIGRMITDSKLGSLAYPGANGGHVHAPSTVAGVTQTYDANGNRTGDGTYTFGYDALNRMTSSTVGGVSTAYVYDGDGTRVKAGSTVFVWLDGQLLYQATGASTMKYFYYGTERIARKDNAAVVSYYVGTNTGSPHAILNSAATVVRKSIYGPYGTLLNQSGTLTDSFGLAGQYRDATGLYQAGARYLSTTTAAFTSPDPSGALDVTAPQTLNRYAYAHNDPMTLVDPTGYAPTTADNTRPTGQFPPTKVGYDAQAGVWSLAVNIEVFAVGATYSDKDGLELTFGSNVSVNKIWQSIIDVRLSVHDWMADISSTASLTANGEGGGKISVGLSAMSHWEHHTYMTAIEPQASFVLPLGQAPDTYTLAYAMDSGVIAPDLLNWMPNDPLPLTGTYGLMCGPTSWWYNAPTASSFLDMRLPGSLLTVQEYLGYYGTIPVNLLPQPNQPWL